MIFKKLLACALTVLPALYVSSAAAEADLKLPREQVTLVAPPFVHPHDQVAKSGPKIVEFKLTVMEKPITIDDAGTTIPRIKKRSMAPFPDR